MNPKLGITLDYILGTLDAIAQVAELVPGAQGPLAALADKYIKIAQAANRAHLASTGQPLDLSLLAPVTPAA